MGYVWFDGQGFNSNNEEICRGLIILIMQKSAKDVVE